MSLVDFLQSTLTSNAGINLLRRKYKKIWLSVNVLLYKVKIAAF
jgi:hypothetical protein